jgi:glutathione S-transferase
MSKIEIISHPLCPYTHRLRMIAAAKGWTNGNEYTVTNLAYATLPQTIGQHSPSGELPVLKIDGVLQTSKTVPIAEYLDGVTGLGLLPKDPGLRLKVRERERRAGELLDSMRGMFGGQSESDVKAAIASVFAQLEVIDADLASDGTDETTMRMDMAAIEPALALLLYFPELRDHPRWTKVSRLKGIGERALGNPFVRDTLAADYARQFEEFFKMTRSAFPQTVLGRSAT